MSGAVRVGLVFGIAAVLAIVGSTLLGLIVPLGGCLGFISVIALGLGAGYTAAKVTMATREQRIGRGATAGAIAGLIVLVLGTLASILLTQLPEYQAQMQATLEELQQNPNVAIDPNDLAAFAGITGVAASFCSGLINAIVMVICGLLGALFWKGAPAASGYGPQGGYGHPGTGYGQTSTDYSQSGTGYGQQGGYGQSGTDYNQPGTYDQPGGGYGQSGTGYNQPGTGYDQPGGAYGQSDTGGYGGQSGVPPEGTGGTGVYDPDDRNRM